MRKPAEFDADTLKRVADAVYATLVKKFGQKRVSAFLQDTPVAHEFCRQTWIETRKAIELDLPLS